MGVCDFLTSFPNWPGGHTPWPISTQNGSNDVGSHKDVPFGGKNRNFLKPLTPRPPKPPKFAQFWYGLWEYFHSISSLTLEVSRVNTPYSSSEPNKSVIVNRQCRGGKFKYVPKLHRGYRSCDSAHAQWQFAQERQFGTQYLENC